jgi:hypothetical protein
VIEKDWLITTNPAIFDAALVGFPGQKPGLACEVQIQRKARTIIKR